MLPAGEGNGSILRACLEVLAGKCGSSYTLDRKLLERKVVLSECATLGRDAHGTMRERTPASAARSAKSTLALRVTNVTARLPSYPKRNHCEISQSTLFLQRPALKGNQLTTPNLLRYYQNPTDLGKGNTQLEPTLAILSYLTGLGGEKRETFVEFTVQRYRVTKRHRPTHVMTELPLPHTSHY